MPSRLASDRPIKNVIGSVNQTLLQRRGWAGRWVGGSGRGGRVGRTLGVVQIEKRERNGEVCHCNALIHTVPSLHCPEALSNSYKGVQLLCFAVCLYRGRGDDDLSLFVGISGSLMWLWCDYAGEPGLPEPLKVTVDVLALMFLSVLCMRSARQTCCFFIPGKGLVFSQEGHDALVVFFTVQQTRRASPCHIKSSAYWRVCLSRLGARIMCICCQISSVRKRTRAPPHTLLLEVLH